MLIKLQKTRFSSEYMVIENAKNVVYRDKPIMFFSEGAMLDSMTMFVNTGAAAGSPSHTCWYQTKADEPLYQGYELEFQDGYAINEISFDNESGDREVIRFDGEAFICNDEG